MGAGASSLGKTTLNREEVLKGTQNPRFLMERILKFILEEISEKDLYRMQDPTTCSKFLILTADSLERLFYSIDVEPVTSKSGKLYFQSVSTLTDPKSPEMKEKIRANCLALGYFYIRILQIYLALALSIIDDPQLVPGRVTSYIGTPLTSRVQLPGAAVAYTGYGGNSNENIILPQDLGLKGKKLPEMIFVGDGSGPIQMGGGPDDFTFESLIKAGILTTTVDKNKLKFSRKSNLIITTSQQNGTTGIVSEESLFNQPIAGPYGQQVSLKPKISIILEKRSGISRIIIQEIVYPSYGRLQQSRINVKLPLDSEYDPVDITKYGTLPTFFDRVLTELSQGKTSILDSLTSVVEKNESETNYAKLRGKNRQLIPLVASSKDPMLDFGESVKALEVKPLAHCVARSFQLLNIDALGSTVPKSARSHICQTKFLESATILVPGEDESITKIPGLKALNFLFFVLNKTVRLSDRTKIEYEAALQELSEAFSDKTFTGSDGKMQSITSKTDSSCGSLKGKEVILGQNGIAAARKGVSQLWGYQLQHAIKVEQIFKKLFRIDTSIKGQVGIGFNPFIIKGGIPAIEKISEEARILLVQYYSNCEKIYKTAVKQIRASAVPITKL